MQISLLVVYSSYSVFHHPLFYVFLQKNDKKKLNNIE